MLKRAALLVGIDLYDRFTKLSGCVADATAMKEKLRRNEDYSPNYGCKLMLYGQDQQEMRITRVVLRRALEELFKFDGDVLFYFSGHGALTATGGYLATCDAEPNDWGVPMQDLLDTANRSRARDILILLDCCHAGDAGAPSLLNQPGQALPISALRENMTIIAAAKNTQAAMESGGHGLFTSSVLEALDGGAADHMGWVTAPAIYAYVERRFNEWSQRPIYKTSATELAEVRRCAPLIERLKLEEIVSLFPTQNYKYELDPEYEPEDENGKVRKPVNKEKVRIAGLFKDYRDVGLLKASIPGEQFYWVARRSHSVELTLRGREYWRLVKYDRI
ncbi:MAG TPA: caspase family protein [Pyrinomonadaceae bacterium]